MKYRTINELGHFRFEEAYISDIQKKNGCFQFTLDNVTICPENTKNRDIREMRTNACVLSIRDGRIVSLYEEGYSVYNADGRLMEQIEDKMIAKDSYYEVLKSIADSESCVISLEKKDFAVCNESGKSGKDGSPLDTQEYLAGCGESVYTFTIETENDQIYVFSVAGTGDTEEWDRFLNK